MSVAQIILQQLGNNKFRAMTGAKEFVSDVNSLRFKLPSRFAKDGINVVVVTLTPEDVYDIVFYKMWGTKINEISRAEGIYCDNLQETFTRHTGLDTHL